MSWRRGLLFALIHLSIAVPLIIWREAQDLKYLRGANEQSYFRLASFQESAGDWNPKTIDYWVQPDEAIVRYVNLPASILAGWHYPPHSIVTVAALSVSMFGGVNHRSESATATGFVVLIFLQWLFVGGFPVIRPKRLWLEPAVLITLCAALSILLLVVPFTRESFSVPLLVAMVTWFVWLCAGIAKVAKVGWRTVVRRD